MAGRDLFAVKPTKGRDLFAVEPTSASSAAFDEERYRSALRKVETELAGTPETTEPGAGYRGAILPFSVDAAGKGSFDIDAGLPGMAKRVFNLPGDVLGGVVDPQSDEGMRRSLEFAATISPLGVASRASPSMIPGTRYKEPAPKVPTQEALKEATAAGYKKAAEAGIEYTGSGIKNFADDVARYLDEEGFIAELSPKTRALLSKLQAAPEGSTANLKSIDAFRKQLNRIAGSPDRTESGAANIVIQRVDRFLENTVPADVVARPAGSLPAIPGQSASRGGEQAVRILGEARGNAAAGFRSERVTGLGDAAALRAAAANSGQNIGNTIRQRLASLILSRKDSRGFSKEEIASLKQIVEGTGGTNLMRRLSNMLGGGGGLGQTLIASGGAALGGTIGGVPGAIVGAGLPAGLGAGARAIANRLTKKQLSRADELVRMRSPLYKSRLQNTPSRARTAEWRAAMARMLIGQQRPLSMSESEIAAFLQSGGV